MTAASSSSRGTASKLLRMTYRLNGSWMAVCTIARPTSVLVSFNWANIRNIGVSSAWYGMISASSRKTNSASLRRDREAGQRVRRPGRSARA